MVVPGLMLDLDLDTNPDLVAGSTVEVGQLGSRTVSSVKVAFSGSNQPREIGALVKEEPVPAKSGTLR